MTKKELTNHIFEKKSFLCVGLDPDIEKLPLSLRGNFSDILPFLKAIIDATAPYAVAFKPNVAFFECFGAKGWELLAQTIAHIRNYHPHHFIIADAKRGDIGNTSAKYADTFFDELGADAVTVAPYMGQDSVEPFLKRTNKWTVLLALTSNKGSHDFQFVEDREGKKLFEKVIEKSLKWAPADNIMYVVGATQGEQIGEVRKIAKTNFLLVPGVGKQGGSLEDVAKYGFNDECGVLVNASRSILYASDGDDYVEAAASEAKALAEEMASLLERFIIKQGQAHEQ